MYPPDGLTSMWTRSARTGIFTQMNCPASTARILLLLGMTVLCAASGFSAEPGMVFIPGGEFARGRAHEHADSKLPYYPNPLRDDLPVKTIHVDPFYMDETEVTNARYAGFIK